MTEDKESSKSDSPSISWSSFPERQKKLVVNYLDHKSRCRLEKCSKNDRKIVGETPLSFDKVLLSFARRHVRLQIDTLFIESEHYKSVETAIKDFLLIFKNPESKFGEVVFQYLEGLDNDHVIQVNLLLHANLQLLPTNFHISAENLYYGLMGTRDECLEVFRRFQPRTLKRIRIKTLKLEKEEWEDVVNTEQWKNAKRMDIELENSLPIKELFRFDSYYTIVEQLDSGDAANIILNFATQKRPRGSHFYVSSAKDLDLEEITDLALSESMDKPVVQPFTPTVFLYTQNYQLAEKTCLVVLVMKNEITGKLCNEDNLDDESTELYAKYLPKYLLDS